MNKILQQHGWHHPGYCAKWGRWTKSRDWHHPVHGGIITERKERDAFLSEWCHWRKAEVFSGSNQYLAPGSKPGKDAILMPAKQSLKIYLEQLDNQLKAA